MLKFFRRLRRKLLDEGNLKRYLLYAIGEILLVVIGILIALQINNWNENKKYQSQEFNYLLEINKEFKRNAIKLDSIVIKHRDILKNCESIIAMFPISKEQTHLDSLSKYINNILDYHDFKPSQNSINSLTNLSSYQNMKNEHLKKTLDRWNVVFTEYQTVEKQAMDYLLNEFTPYMNDNFDFDFDLTDPRTNFNLLRTFRFENIIKERAWRQRDIIERNNFLSDLQNTIGKIIELTDQEIKKNGH